MNLIFWGFLGLLDLSVLSLILIDRVLRVEARILHGRGLKDFLFLLLLLRFLSLAFSNSFFLLDLGLFPNGGGLLFYGLTQLLGSFLLLLKHPFDIFDFLTFDDLKF